MLLAIDIKFLLTWLKEIDFVGQITGNSAHPEVIKASHDLLVFLVEHEEFSKDHFERLWSLISGHSNALRSAVFDILLEVISGATNVADLLSHTVEKVIIRIFSCRNPDTIHVLFNICFIMLSFYFYFYFYFSFACAHFFFLA